MTLLHISDLHLGALGKGVTRAFSIDLQRKQWNLLLSIKSIVLSKKIDILVITGDLFDHERIDIQWVYKVSSIVSELLAKNVVVIYCTGNHDYFVQDETFMALQKYQNFGLFCGDIAKTYVYEVKDKCIAFHGVGYNQKQPRKAIASDYPEALDVDYNIGVGHGICATKRETKSNYYIYDQNDCAAKGYDMWLLGHVHEHMTIDQNIVYAGAALPSKYSDFGYKYGLLFTFDRETIGTEKLKLSSLHITRHTLTISAQSHHHFLLQLNDTLAGIITKEEGYIVLDIIADITYNLSNEQKSATITMLHEQYAQIMVHALDVSNNINSTINEDVLRLFNMAIDHLEINPPIHRDTLLNACLDYIRGQYNAT